eukprot:1143956-Pelagomonas_calceolata.AAC.2
MPALKQHNPSNGSKASTRQCGAAQPQQISPSAFSLSFLAAAAERVVPTFHAGCVHVRHFFTKTAIIPASMYASQIWGTSYMKEGAEMDCPLQTGHLFFLRVPGVKRSTCNWSVLREYDQEPLQFYWFWAAIRFFNSMLTSNGKLARKVLKADRALSAAPGVKCRTAEILDSFNSS